VADRGEVSFFKIGVFAGLFLAWNFFPVLFWVIERLGLFAAFLYLGAARKYLAISDPSYTAPDAVLAAINSHVIF
jgi:hypothetical protein